jgi:hypothetical protein
MIVQPRASTVIGTGFVSSASLTCAQDDSVPVMSDSRTTTIVTPRSSRLASTRRVSAREPSASSDIGPHLPALLAWYGTKAWHTT